MKWAIAMVFSTTIFVVAQERGAKWPEAKAPAIPEADGFVEIPGAVVPPEKSHVYRAIFDATDFPDEPTQLLTSLNMVGSELNALRVAGVPAANAKFAVVFHGQAIDGVLDDAHYKEKFGIANPNLKVLAELKAAGVELMACGQQLASDQVDPKAVCSDVAIASDALIVLMTYHENGYATFSF